jgi:hypothetical protein
MSPRGPRLAAGLTLLAAGLFAGRWLTQFLADRWWAAAVSSDAGPALGSRALTALGLDAAGVLLALLWFAANARGALRTVAELGPRERGGNAVVREALQDRRAWFWAAVSVGLLALLVGTGVSEWLDTIALAGAGVRFGLPDPALGLDAGWYVAQLPLWLRGQAFAAVLVLTAAGLVGGTYLLAGAIRIGRGRVSITDRARRHLGLLLAGLAVVIGASRVLAPYEHAAGLPAVVVPGVVQLYRSTGFVLAGLAMAAGGVSALWAFRPAHGLVAGAWFAFSAALVGAEALLPSDRPDPRDPGNAAITARFEAIAYGLDVDSAASLPPPARSLWGRGAVAWAAGGDSADPALAVRILPSEGAAAGAAWLALDDRAGMGGPLIRIYADDTAGAGGRPVVRGLPEAGPDLAGMGLERLPPLASRPGAAAIERSDRGGVSLDGLARRLVLAWALQDGALLAADESSVAWHLVPAARLRHLAPWGVWSGTRAWLQDGRLRWIVDGYSVSDAFPASRRRSWLGRTVALVRPGFVGVVDAATGSAEIFLRPGADSLSVAWARASRGLVRPAGAIPPGLTDALAYPEDVLLLQADLLATRGVPQDRAERPIVPGVRGHPLPGPTTGSSAVPLIHRTREVVLGLLVGSRGPGGDRLVLHRPDSAAMLDAPDALQRQWQRLPVITALRDSLLAAGADTLLGQVRYGADEQGLLAWQPLVAADSAGVTLVAIATARGERIGAGRTWEDAWASLQGKGAGRTGLAGPLGALEEARRWAAEADSALRRGDLAGFAKAFGALREALEVPPPGTP